MKMQLVQKTFKLLKMNSQRYNYSQDGFVVIGDERCEPTKKAIAMQLSKGAKAPERATPGDAGADLFAYFGEDLPTAYVEIEPNTQKLIDTGVAVNIPIGYAGFLMARSSMRSKAITCWGDGLIDSGYRGTLKVVVANQGTEPYRVKAGDKIAQLVIKEIELVDFVDIWNDSERGAGGFGSTGK